jgi:hypothetical protein
MPSKHAKLHCLAIAPPLLHHRQSETHHPQKGGCDPQESQRNLHRLPQRASDNKFILPKRKAKVVGGLS